MKIVIPEMIIFEFPAVVVSGKIVVCGIFVVCGLFVVLEEGAITSFMSHDSMMGIFVSIHFVLSFNILFIAAAFCGLNFVINDFIC